MNQTIAPVGARTESLAPGMRFQSTAPGYEHVVCTFGGAAPRFFAAMVARGEWRYVGTDKGYFPRAALCST